jgi:hypothetical protein
VPGAGRRPEPVKYKRPMKKRAAIAEPAPANDGEAAEASLTLDAEPELAAAAADPAAAAAAEPAADANAPPRTPPRRKTGKGQPFRQGCQGVVNKPSLV